MPAQVLHEQLSALVLFCETTALAGQNVRRTVGEKAYGVGHHAVGIHPGYMLPSCLNLLSLVQQPVQLASCSAMWLPIARVADACVEGACSLIG